MKGNKITEAEKIDVDIEDVKLEASLAKLKKLSAKVRTAFEESQHPRGGDQENPGRFSEGEGGGKEGDEGGGKEVEYPSEPSKSMHDFPQDILIEKQGDGNEQFEKISDTYGGFVTLWSHGKNHIRVAFEEGGVGFHHDTREKQMKHLTEKLGQKVIPTDEKGDVASKSEKKPKKESKPLPKLDKPAGIKGLSDTDPDFTKPAGKKEKAENKRADVAKSTYDKMSQQQRVKAIMNIKGMEPGIAKNIARGEFNELNRSFRNKVIQSIEQGQKPKKESKPRKQAVSGDAKKRLIGLEKEYNIRHPTGKERAKGKKEWDGMSDKAKRNTVKTMKTIPGFTRGTEKKSFDELDPFAQVLVTDMANDYMLQKPTGPDSNKKQYSSLDDLKLTANLVEMRIAAGNFEESKHPRDKGGEFTSKGGGEGKDDESSRHMKNPDSEDHQPFADNAIETFHTSEQASAAGGKHPVVDDDTGLYYKDNGEWKSAHGEGSGDVIDIETFNSLDEAKKAGNEKPVVDDETGLVFSSNQSWQNAHGAGGFEDDTLHIIKPSQSKTKSQKSKPKKTVVTVDDKLKDTELGSKAGYDPSRGLGTKSPGKFLNDSQVSTIHNDIMREVDPDEQGENFDVGEGTMERISKKYDISKEDAWEIFDSDGTPDYQIKKNQSKTGKFTYRVGKNDTFEFRTSRLRTGSLVDDFRPSNGDRYVSYFLLNDTENLKGWGVQAASIPKNIDTFKNMPFVVTKQSFFANSPYGTTTDHPSTEHFKDLDIRVGRDIAPQKNDMMLQASFQERFRVGNIDEIIRAKDGNYLAFIKIDPKFANHEMPPLVSPAIFQLNPMEPADNIRTWVGMHLAGLDERPAYGNYAVYKGSCNGDKGSCLTQLSASMPKFAQGLPACTMKKIFNARLKVASMRLMSAAQMSSDHPQIQKLNVYGETQGKRERSGGGPGSGRHKKGGETNQQKHERREKLFKEHNERVLQNTPGNPKYAGGPGSGPQKDECQDCKRRGKPNRTFDVGDNEGITKHVQEHKRLEGPNYEPDFKGAKCKKKMMAYIQESGVEDENKIPII